MTLAPTLFGENLPVGTDSAEVRRILQKFPAGATNTGLFFYACMRDRLPWVAQLDEARQLELRAFCRDIESLRRRRQEVHAEDERAKHGG